MSQVIHFENEEPKTIFAPVYKYFMYQGEVDVKDIRDVILSKEEEVINSHEYKNDWNTGLGKDSMRNSHDNFVTTLNEDSWEDKIYVQCWANVLRKGQAIKQHQHWNTRYTYLGGHICLDNYDTHTYYINPYNRKSIDTKNEKGHVYLFPNWVEHYTDTYEGDDSRVTIAFDIITQTVYDEDIFDNMKDHWVQL